MQLITKSSDETKKFAAEFAKNLKGRDLVCLYGDLGSGKTTFVQGLAGGLGVKKRVLSPTFVFVRIYPLDVAAASHAASNGQVRQEVGRRTAPQLQVESKRLKLVHIDLHRIEKPEDIDSLDLDEFWSDPENIVVIEWAEKAEGLLPRNRTNIRFKYVSEDERLVVIEKVI